VAHPLKTYWKLYGGIFSFLKSPYLFAAVILTCICYPLWASATIQTWPGISISVLPSLMGFSVAGMTVLLAFSDSKSLRAITQKGRADSYFVKTVANLFHFLIVQSIALILAVVASAFPKLPTPFPAYALSFFGLLALIYAVFVAIAAGGQLLNTAMIINKAVWTPDSKPDAASGNQSPEDTESKKPQ
jgi:hypothetical protein